MNKARAKIMTDHVKQRMIGFAEWLDDNEWSRSYRDKLWYKLPDINNGRTTEYVCEQYLKTVTKGS